MNLRLEVNDILKDYSEDAIEATKEVVEKVAKESAKRLKSVSSEKFGSGKYARGWTSTVEKTRLTVEGIVHGKSGTYQLAHLLEHGHVTRNGTGRTFAPTPAHPHIADVEEWANQKAYNDIMEKLEKI